MGTHNNPPTDFESIYNHIRENCEKHTPGYEQINYLNKLIAECVRFREYELMYEAEIIDDDELGKIMPKVTKHFYALLEDPKCEFEGSDSFNDVLMLYHKENDKLDYQEFFNSAGKLIKELNKDSKGVRENMETSFLKDGDISKIEKIKVKSHLTDIVRVFEAMEFSEMIDLQTQVKQFAELFFEEVIDQIKFEKKYNAAKSKLNKYMHATNSKVMVKFVKRICSECFHRKYEILEDLITHLEGMQKLSI